MKRISRFLLLSIFLTSCANAVTSAPVVTETSAPTATLALTNTPQPTPKPPEDPFKGMPDGTNRVENGVPYMDKTENGKTHTFVWTEKTDALTEEIVFSEWTREITDNEGIPIIDWGDYPKVAGTIQVHVSEKALGSLDLPFIFTYTRKTPNDVNESDLTSKAKVSVFNRIYGKNPSGIEAGEFDYKLANGVPIEFFIGDQTQKYTFSFGPDHITNVFITDWDSLEGEPDITNNPIGISLRSKILGVDKDGNLMGVIATNVPLDTLTEEQWSEIILWHTASIVDRKDQGKQYFNRTIGSWVAFAGRKNPNTWIEQVSNN